MIDLIFILSRVCSNNNYNDVFSGETFQQYINVSERRLENYFKNNKDT